MEEIKVGEYVRTKSGEIGIFKKYAEEGVQQWFTMLQNGTLYTTATRAIVKHSKNIIDLIEVGDIVNKSEVFEKGMQRDGEKWIYTYQGKLYFETELEKLTILTKEQYEKNCYTVERKE